LTDLFSPSTHSIHPRRSTQSVAQRFGFVKCRRVVKIPCNFFSPCLRGIATRTRRFRSSVAELQTEKDSLAERSEFELSVPICEHSDDLSIEPAAAVGVPLMAERISWNRTPARERTLNSDLDWTYRLYAQAPRDSECHASQQNSLANTCARVLDFRPFSLLRRGS